MNLFNFPALKEERYIHFSRNWFVSQLSKPTCWNQMRLVAPGVSAVCLGGDPGCVFASFWIPQMTKSIQLYCRLKYLLLAISGICLLSCIIWISSSLLGTVGVWVTFCEFCGFTEQTSYVPVRRTCVKVSGIGARCSFVFDVSPLQAETGPLLWLLSSQVKFIALSACHSTSAWMSTV